MPDPKEGALSRWSRLKRESEATSKTDAPKLDQAAPGPTADAQAEPVEREGHDAIRLEDLPDVETLTYESDFTAFLQKGVPESLQRLALARLWRSNPVLANLDGLNDYDWDFNEGGLTDAIKALTPEQGDKTPVPQREEVLPGRRPQVEAQLPRREEGSHVTGASADAAEGAPEAQVVGGPPRRRKLV